MRARNVSHHTRSNADPADYFPYLCRFTPTRPVLAQEKANNLNLPLAHGEGDGRFPHGDRGRAFGALRITGRMPLVVALGLDASEHDPIGALKVTTPGFARSGGPDRRGGIADGPDPGRAAISARPLPENLAAFLEALRRGPLRTACGPAVMCPPPPPPQKHNLVRPICPCQAGKRARLRFQPSARPGLPHPPGRCRCERRPVCRRDAGSLIRASTRSASAARVLTMPTTSPSCAHHAFMTIDGTHAGDENSRRRTASPPRERPAIRRALSLVGKGGVDEARLIHMMPFASRRGRGSRESPGREARVGPRCKQTSLLACKPRLSCGITNGTVFRAGQGKI